MNFIDRLLNRIFGTFDWNDSEYFQRFIAPKVERARALGIPQSEIDQMWRDAVKYADPFIVGRAPGSLFANMIDVWELNHTDDVETTEVSK